MSFVAVAIGGAAIAGIGSAAIGAHAAGEASKSQANSANYAADLQKQSADNSLAFQKQVYSDQQANQKPYLDQGKVALGQIGTGLAAGGQFTQTLNADNFKQLDPGFDFRMSEGLKALNRAQAAGGNIGSGGALKAATEFGQDYASGEFANAYQRFKSNQDTNFNRLASLAGLGQTATQGVNAAGSNAAGNIASINANYANGAGNALMAAGNATASGYMGAANAWGSGLNTMANSGMNLAMMNKLFGTGGTAGGAAGGAAGGGIFDSSGNYIGE